MAGARQVCEQPPTGLGLALSKLPLSASYYRLIQSMFVFSSRAFLKHSAEIVYHLDGKNASVILQGKTHSSSAPLCENQSKNHLKILWSNESRLLVFSVTEQVCLSSECFSFVQRKKTET